MPSGFGFMRFRSWLAGGSGCAAALRIDLGVLASYGVLAAAMLAPLSMHPASMAIANEDVYGNAWAMAWVVHQGLRAPLRLYDANIFHPVPSAFAYTEPLLPQAVQAAPLIWLGCSPLTAHNVVVLLTFPLTAFTTYWLARDLFGTRAGAWIAGLSFAFCAYRLDHLVHVQSLSMQWLPVAILFGRQALMTGRRRHLVGVAACGLAQALSSGYYAVLVATALALIVPFYATREKLGFAGRYLAALGLAGSLAVVVFLPHRTALARESSIRGYKVMRSPEEMIHWSAKWSSYLDPGERAPLPYQAALHRRFPGGESLYPGVFVLALAAIGLAAWRSREVRFAMALTAAGVALSLGPQVRILGWVVPGVVSPFSDLPPFSALRTPSRFGVLAVLGLCLLAAAGVRIILQRQRGAWIVGIVAIGTLVDVQPGLHRRALMHPVVPPPPTVGWLAAAAPGPTLELPWDHETMGNDGQYVYWSTGHWQHLVNGWGGWYPTGPFELGVSAKRFPSRASSRELRRAGVRYVVVHLDAMPKQRRERILATHELPPGVSLAADFGAHRIFEIDPRGPLDRAGKTKGGDAVTGAAGERPSSR